MSFRKYGGTQFASSHNIVKSNVNTTASFYVTQNVGQPNTYINFESDISGNMNIYGNLDVSGNISVSGDVDINGNLQVQENIDCSGNVNIDGDVDINGNLQVQENIDCSGNVTAEYMFLSAINPTYVANSVVPKSYIDSLGAGLKPLGSVTAISSFDSSGNNTTYPVPIDPNNITLPFLIDGVSIQVGENVLLNDQGTPSTAAAVNNGVYTLIDLGSGSYQFQRSTLMPIDLSSNSIFISVDEGIVNSLTGWVQINENPPDEVGTTPIIFSKFFSFSYRLGQGLYSSTTSGQIYVNVDSNLNFIQYLDNTAGPGTNTMNIGTNTPTINIGNGTGTGTTKFNGKVGIGTSTPQYPLDVSGNANITLSTASNTNPNLTLTGGVAGVGGAYLQLFGNGYSGENVGINLDTFSGRAGGPATTIRSVDNGSYSGNLQFLTANSGSTSNVQAVSMVINPQATGNAFVGIGTTTPQFAFDVSGNLNTNADAYINGLTVGLGGGNNNTNTALGYQALYSNTGGYDNSVFGNASLQSNTEGFENSAFGYASLQSNTEGNENSAFGLESLNSNTTGTGNSAFGIASFFSLTGASNSNSAFGGNSGINLVNGSNNSFFGVGSGVDVSSNTYIYSTAIGYAATINASNQMVLGGLSSPSGGVYPGIFIPGSYVGIGGVYNPATPQYTLDVSGNINFTGSLLEDGQPFSGATQWTTSGSNIYYSGGFVGINNLTPQYALDVNGTINVTAGPLTANAGITTNTLSVSGNPGYLLTLQNNAAVYNGGQSNILFNGAYQLGSITTQDIASGTGAAYQSQMTFNVNWNTNLIPGMSITGYYPANSCVGINGATFNGSYALNVNGAVNATSYNSPSDYRIKKDVIPLDDKFTVDKLRPVTYNNTKLEKQDIGLIAHELQEVYPFLVNGEKDGENLQSVNYTGLIGILIKEIQELKERIKKLEEK